MPALNKSEQAYVLLEEWITFQELPPGMMLSETILMEQTGFGRTPIREALQRLARDRMVEIHPNRGTFVAFTSVEAQLKLLELRRTMEEFAVRLATHRANDQQKAAMLEMAADLESARDRDARSFAPLLKHTHELIVAAAGNEFLSVAMTPLQGLSRRFWFAHLRDAAQEIHKAAELHAGILRAIASGDENAATTASLRLNDYLVEFAYRTLHDRALPRPSENGRTTVSA